MQKLTRWCSECEQEKPEDEFFRPRQRGFTCVICNACAHANMLKWLKTGNVGREPDQVKDKGD